MIDAVLHFLVPIGPQVFHANQVWVKPAVAVGATFIGRALLIDAFRIDAELRPQIRGQQRVQAMLPELGILFARCG
jgi:hypothetical protein